MKLVSHSVEIIRKKAIIVLTRFMKLNPGMISEYLPYFQRTLCDKEPSVMGATLNAFGQIMMDESFIPKCKELIPSFVVILKQIIDHRLPRDFDYHRMPAPWLQTRLLQLLAVLGEDDKRASEQMYEVLGDVMRRADDTGVNAGYAIVYECLKTITKIYPNNNLIENAAQLVARLLTAENNNLKHTGITALINIVKINPTYAVRHQLVVVDCLEDVDETLKRKTMTLLYKMTNTGNVTVIIDKFNNILNSASFDLHLKQEIITKISELAEKFAPDSKWYLMTMNNMFQSASELIKPSSINSLIKLIDEWRDDREIISFTVEEYLKVLSTEDTVPDPLLKVAAWVLGEFVESVLPSAVNSVMDLLCKLLFKPFDEPSTKGWVLTALQKLSKGVPSDECRELISRFSTSRNEDLQQRCYELAGTCTRLSRPLNFKNNINQVQNFGFLEKYVQQQMMQGAKTYNPELNRRFVGLSVGKARDEYKASDAIQSMRIEAYSNPVEKVHSRSIEKSNEVNELHVKKQVWSSEGYKGDLSGSSTSAAVNVGNVSSGGVPVSGSSHSSALNFAGEESKMNYLPSKTYVQPKPPVKTEKELARESLANTLFGNFAPGSEVSKNNQSFTPVVHVSSTPNVPSANKKNDIGNLLDL
jgi:AP-4 complex subunit epsilon-1